jgi:hypothetical protein
VIRDTGYDMRYVQDIKCARGMNSLVGFGSMCGIFNTRYFITIYLLNIASCTDMVKCTYMITWKVSE